MTATTIDAVLFDLHGVITSSPWSAIASAGAASGLPEEEVLRFMLGDYAEDSDHAWHRLERGEISLAAYGADLVQRAADAGLALDFDQLRGLNSRVQVNDVVVDTIRRLHDGGTRTALVTNNVRELASSWRKLLPVDDLFDAVVDSCQVGMRKPNPSIFLHTLELLGGVTPSRAAFLDDAPGNVEGARRAGLHTILVTDVDAALAELDRLMEAA